MTDEGALPAAFSNSLYELKNLGLIDCIVTCGQAFGGDYEAVNIFSALITAKEIVRADAAMVGMGPGNVGTGTKWGFSGTQLGEIINAVNILEGKPVFCPRISFSDPRERHQGISHHSLTVLSKTALTPAITVFPHLSPEKRKILKKQIREMGIEQKHRIIWEYGESGWGKLQDSNLHISTMGRDIHEDKDFFLGACATGIYGAKVSMQVGIN